MKAMIKPTKAPAFLAAAFVACTAATAWSSDENSAEPPEPPADMQQMESDDGQPPEPPDWERREEPPEWGSNDSGEGGSGEMGGRQSGRRPPRGRPPHMRSDGNSSDWGGRGMGGRRGGPGGRGGRGGGMRGDDPSDASQYSGMKEITGAEKLSGVELHSVTNKVSPIYVKAGGELSLKGGKISSDASSANGILVIGKGAKARVEDVTIATTKDSSRGLYAFQKGEIYAKNVKISTKGAHCAAMATDRGEGVVKVDGGVLNTAGDGSPCIYSTGELAAANVKGEATGSEAMVIEGRNSITLVNADLTGWKKCGAMLYQSFSGDALEGVAKLTMRSSRLCTHTGSVFFVTNTRAEIDLEDSTLEKTDASLPLLKVAPARWGRSGSNGGSVTLRAKKQKLEGDVVVSSTSSATIELGDGAVLTGTLDAKGEAKELNVKLSKDAKLVLTGDSRVTSLQNADASGANIIRNGHKLSVAASAK